jgi:hypothetical protein
MSSNLKKTIHLAILAVLAGIGAAANANAQTQSAMINAGAGFISSANGIDNTCGAIQQDFATDWLTDGGPIRLVQTIPCDDATYYVGSMDGGQTYITVREDNLAFYNQEAQGDYASFHATANAGAGVINGIEKSCDAISDQYLAADQGLPNNMAWLSSDRGMSVYEQVQCDDLTYFVGRLDSGEYVTIRSDNLLADNNTFVAPPQAPEIDQDVIVDIFGNDVLVEMPIYDPFYRPLYIYEIPTGYGYYEREEYLAQRRAEYRAEAAQRAYDFHEYQARHGEVIISNRIYTTTGYETRRTRIAQEKVIIKVQQNYYTTNYNTTIKVKIETGNAIREQRLAAQNRALRSKLSAADYQAHQAKIDEAHKLHQAAGRQAAVTRKLHVAEATNARLEAQKMTPSEKEAALNKVRARAAADQQIIDAQKATAAKKAAARVAYGKASPAVRAKKEEQAKVRVQARIATAAAKAPAASKPAAKVETPVKPAPKTAPATPKVPAAKTPRAPKAATTTPKAPAPAPVATAPAASAPAAPAVKPSRSHRAPKAATTTPAATTSDANTQAPAAPAPASRARTHRAAVTPTDNGSSASVAPVRQASAPADDGSAARLQKQQAKAQADADRQAAAEAKAQAKAQADADRQAAAQARAQADADRQAKQQAEAQAKADRAAKQQAEEQARAEKKAQDEAAQSSSSTTTARGHHHNND